MAAAAHTKGGFGGVPQSVGKEFNDADKAKGYNKGGAVAPSGEQMFENNLAEVVANPTGPTGLNKGGGVRNWKRWGQK